MTKTRLEAFSDGVLAIVITIMVLEIKVPHDYTIAALIKLWPVFLSYVLSFVFIGIYWGNHHHLFQTMTRVNSRIIWSNLHLLFWLTLIPFSTGWMGENHFEELPVALYSVNLILCALAYYILQKSIVAHHTYPEALAMAMKKQEKKGMLSLIMYLAAIPLAFVHTGISELIFIAVAILWVIPDKRIEKALHE
jgi:uncharacterized membrane protein